MGKWSNPYDYIYPNRLTFVWVCNHIPVWEKQSEIGSNFLVFFTFMNYFYVNRGRHLYECLVTCLRKITSEIGLKFLVYFTFINFFMKNYNLLSNCAFGPFYYVAVKNVCQASLFLLLTWVSTAIFRLDQC